MTGGELLRYVGAALLAAVLVVAGSAAPASAHTELDNAIPAAGVTLEKTPGSIQLTFTEPVDAALATVVVRGPGGRDLADGPARQAASALMQPITPAAEAGTIEVAYRVVSLDGHPVSGTYSFEVLRGDATSNGSGDFGPGAGGTDTTDDAGGVSITVPLLAAGVVVLLIALGGFAARRRQRGQVATSAPQPTPPSA